MENNNKRTNGIRYTANVDGDDRTIFAIWQYDTQSATYSNYIRFAIAGKR